MGRCCPNFAGSFWLIVRFLGPSERNPGKADEIALHFHKKQIALFQTANTPGLFRQKIMKFMKEDWITATPTIQHFMFRVFQIELQDLNYRKVASSRPVYYSILELLGQRSQYIRIKFPLHKPSENLKMCY